MIPRARRVCLPSSPPLKVRFICANARRAYRPRQVASGNHRVCGAITLLLDPLRYDRRSVSNGAVLGPGRAFARERFAFPISTPGVYSLSSRGAADTQQGMTPGVEMGNAN